MNENAEQIRKVLSDEAFVKTLLEAENEEAVQKLLADKGVEMSLTEIELLGEMLEAGAQGELNMEALEKVVNGGELSEDDLEAAAGGYGVGEFFMDVKDFFLQPHFYQNGQELAGNMHTLDNVLDSTIKYSPTTASKIIAGVVAVAGIGYGIYDAVRRRW